MRKEVSGLDQIFVVNQIVEKTIEKNKKTYVAFVEKAYDNVSREKLWRVLDRYGVKGKLLRAVKALYSMWAVERVCKLEAWYQRSLR